MYARRRRRGCSGSVSVLSVGAANASPINGEAARLAKATPEFETCTIYTDGSRIYFFSVSGAILGTVGSGQKINRTGWDTTWTYGVLWGRTDVTKVGTHWVYC